MRQSPHLRAEISIYSIVFECGIYCRTKYEYAVDWVELLRESWRRLELTLADKAAFHPRFGAVLLLYIWTIRQVQHRQSIVAAFLLQCFKLNNVLAKYQTNSSSKVPWFDNQLWKHCLTFQFIATYNSDFSKTQIRGSNFRIHCATEDFYLLVIRISNEANFSLLLSLKLATLKNTQWYGELFVFFLHKLLFNTFVYALFLILFIWLNACVKVRK